MATLSPNSEKVIARQIQLVVERMRVGFIHGVMNTDNTSLSRRPETSIFYFEPTQGEERGMDDTITFDLLTKSLMSEAAASMVKNELGECFDLGQKRLSEQRAGSQEVQDLM
ncbi:MAG: protein adenylyltransferase SelO family protein [Desulfobacterales bacterium]